MMKEDKNDKDKYDEERYIVSGNIFEWPYTD